MSDVIDIFAVVISIIATLVSVYTWKKTRPIERKQYDVESMVKVFEYISDDSVIQAKMAVSAEFWKLKDKAEKAIFTGSVNQDAGKIKTAYDKVGVLYNLGLLDKESLKIYDGNIIRTWLLLEDDILNDRTKNQYQCTSFETMKNDIKNYWHEKHPQESFPKPYRPTDSANFTFDIKKSKWYEQRDSWNLGNPLTGFYAITIDVILYNYGKLDTRINTVTISFSQGEKHHEYHLNDCDIQIKSSDSRKTSFTFAIKNDKIESTESLIDASLKIKHTYGEEIKTIGEIDFKS